MGVNKNSCPLKSGELLFLSVITVVIFLFCLPFLRNINNIYYEQQWLDNVSYQAFLTKSLLEFKQFSFWSPFFGGGYPFIGHPESLSLSPFLIFFLCFGEWIGYKLFFLTGYILGGWGMFYLTRNILKYNLWGSVFSSLLFTLTSFFPYHLHSGNFYLANFFYFPFLFSFVIKMERNNPSVFFAGLILAFLLINGISLYWITVILFLSLFVVFKSAGFGRNTEHPGGAVIFKGFVFNSRYFNKWLVVVMLAALLGAIKLFPLWEIITKNIRAFDNYTVASAGSSNFHNLLLSLFSRGPYKKPVDWFPDGSYADSVMYFGFIPVVLCLLSFFLYRKQKETKIFFALLVIFSLLSLGKNSPVDIFKLLWHMPLFHSVHDPSRYFSFYILFIIALVSGKIYGYFERSNRIIKGFMVLLIFLGLNDMFWTNRKYHENLFNTPLPQVSAEKSFYQVKTYNRPVCPRGYVPVNQDSYQYFWLLRNTGKIDWISDLNLAEHAAPKYYVDETTGQREVNPDYKGEVYFSHKDNKAELSFFSPNKMFIDVEVHKPDSLIVNQNYNRNWKTNFGNVKNFKGLVSVPLEKEGKYRVELYYRPSGFYAGSVVSLLSLIVSVFVFGKKRVNEKASE